jgi:Na+/H+ antiporter NhaA
MQKIATRLFAYSSVAFGIIGILVVLTLSNTGDNNSSPLHILLMKLMFGTVFIILPSFALSVAGKYLSK